MPIAPAVACRCGGLDCTKHNRAAARKEFDRRRQQDPLRAIYNTARWQRTRAFIIARDPLCEIGVKALKENRPQDALCVQRYGVAMPSTDADHITPIRQGGDPWDPENLQGVCHECHARKTALEQSQTERI